MKQLIRRGFHAGGFDIVRYRRRSKDNPLPTDITAEDQSILDRITPYTVTSRERQIALIHAIRYIVRSGIAGCLVECGVWRGGSSMASVLTLMQEGDTSRDVYLFDTFEGMTPPTDKDRLPSGTLAKTLLDRDRKPEKVGSVWAAAGIDDVRQNMESTGYPLDHVKYVQGPVEETLPSRAPAEPIALLRLDTDWYESTKQELTHLFPLLSSGGILIIDDYGHWEGAKKAVDEHFATLGRPYFLHRIDYAGRLVVKF